MSGHDETRDDELSRLYREVAPGEPPARLDDAILAAAKREAVRATPRRERPWWRRWTVPVSVAALVVLSVSLSLLVSREQERVEIPAPAAAPAVPQCPLAPGTDQAPAAAPPREAEKSAVPEPPAARARKSAPAPAPVPEQRPASPANVMERKEEARRSEVFVPVPKPAAKAADGGAAPAAPLSPAAGEAEAAAGAATDNAKPGAGIESRTAPQGSRILSAPAESGAGRTQGAPLREAQQPPSPEAWIEEIRTLRRQGREREAAERLDEFRRAYPGYALPEDLRQPLR